MQTPAPAGVIKTQGQRATREDTPGGNCAHDALRLVRPLAAAGLAAGAACACGLAAARLDAAPEARGGNGGRPGCLGDSAARLADAVPGPLLGVPPSGARCAAACLAAFSLFLPKTAGAAVRCRLAGVEPDSPCGDPAAAALLRFLEAGRGEGSPGEALGLGLEGLMLLR